jgi:3-phenylpropionate/trans-cinnamate dioxygenase ferredoxin subunit
MPDRFVAVAQAADLEPGHMTWVAAEGERLLLANVEGHFYALADICGHKRVPLSRGRLIGCVVECPLHFAQYDLATGKLLSGPVADDVRAYETRVEDGTVYVRR